MIDPRPLGQSSLLVPAVGMGCNNFSRPKTATATQAASAAVIHAGIDAGITFFDGAELYGAEPGLSESFMGVALAGRRDEVVLSTKFGFSGSAGPGLADAGPRGAERYIRAAVEGSLRRLRTDRIDLYQMHSPDPETPIEETLGVLGELVTEGKVREIGNSNFTADQIRAADDAAVGAGARFVSAQNEYSLVARGIEETVLPAIRERHLGLFPYFPLANGLLTGKYTRSGDGAGRLTDIKPDILAATDWDRMDAYQRICDDAGVSMLDATFAWLLAQDGVACVIAGATRPEQVAANAAAGRTRLPADVVAAIGEVFA